VSSPVVDCKLIIDSHWLHRTGIVPFEDLQGLSSRADYIMLVSFYLQNTHSRRRPSCSSLPMDASN
jgi:hypothetical protein